MKVRAAVVFAAGAFCVGVGVAQAQCTFPHGKVTKNNGWTALVQAYVPCGFFNTTTQDGIAACSPPKTPHQVGVSPANGWQLDPASGFGRIRFEARDPTDMRIRLQLHDVRDANTGDVAFVGPGQLKLTVRLTMNDPVNGPLTTADLTLPIDVEHPTGNSGDVTLLTTLNAVLTGFGESPLPPCTAIAIVDAKVYDPNDNLFLEMGHFRFG